MLCFTFKFWARITSKRFLLEFIKNFWKDNSETFTIEKTVLLLTMISVTTLSHILTLIFNHQTFCSGTSESGRFGCINLIQWAPLNGITLGPRETDSYNRLILISERTKHTLGRKWPFGACQLRYIWSH